MKKDIKICYIGGGSKLWARVFMSDLALDGDLKGEIALYDIDKEAAIRNAKIGSYINNNPKTKSIFNYVVYDKLDQALVNADFVIISILPGTFKEMRSDVHTPEKYHIYQSVGDTTGPGGILRAMRTVPLYEDFARKIKEICPTAWVINFTNPMSICTKTLYDVFPEIKAFGCCHEVFHAQELLAIMLKESKGIEISRREVCIDASGINHFTWISKAKYKDIDLMKLIPGFIDKYYDEGYYERKGSDRFAFKYDPFAYGNKVKLDLFNRYGILGAAGDRHLVEFLPNNWYLKDKKTVKEWMFNLTTVDFREENQRRQIEDSILMANGEKEFELNKSDEEAVLLMKALLGYGDIISNVNTINKGQMAQMPLNSIVETNCLFSKNNISPIKSENLPFAVCNLVYRNLMNVETTYLGIKNRDLNIIFRAFVDQPLCGNLSLEEAKELFKEMCYNTRDYLDKYFDLDKYFN